MKKFILYWLDGKLEHIEGNTIAQAMGAAGYGAGAIAALDFYDESTEVKWRWNAELKTWVNIKEFV
ncbi:hypothetical protein [Burkholderia phage BCSR5]|nr:hypothetical protein [Burkholderia phage BCSR5]